MKKLFLIFFYLIISCAGEHRLIGSWHNSYSMLEKANAFFGLNVLQWNNKLVIHDDASWRLEGTCEVIAGSKWLIRKDSLILFPDTSWGVMNQALNMSKPGFNGGCIGYKINQHSLERHCEGYYEGIDKHDSLVTHHIHILEKLEPDK